jgi:type II secretory pathway component PulK
MKRRGMVLLVVLVVAALLALIALGLMFRVRAETSAAAATEGGEQAWYAAMSGIARVGSILRTTSADPKTWYDNPDALMNQLVVDDGRNRWYFTVWAEEVTADGSQPNALRYGVTDEAGKINVSTAEAGVLGALPNMTGPLVDGLMDYRDADNDVRPEGAEQDYYDQLDRPYQIANGPLTTIDELLLVKGFTARTLYGEDANRNGLLDSSECDGDATFPPDDGDGVLDRGLHAVATVVSAEPNVDSQGRARVNINTGSLSSGLGLPQQTLDFIRIYKAEGNTFKHPSELLEMQYTLTQSESSAANNNLMAGETIESGVGAAELPAVLDRLTALTSSSGQLVKGLVNVNTAPAEVLSALPGLGGSAAQQIIETRRGLDAQTMTTPAWLYSQAGLSAASFKAVAPLLTARSYQYSVRCIGFGVPSGRFRIVEAIIDLAPPAGSASTSSTGSAQAATPRIVYLRDLTRLGLPFPLDPDSIEHSQK